MKQNIPRLRGTAFLCLTLTLAMVSAGCRSMQDEGPSAFDDASGPFSLDEVKRCTAPAEGEETAEVVLSMLRGARVSVMTTKADVISPVTRNQDRVFVVLEGQGIFLLDSMRHVVSTGHVIIVLRGSEFQFQTRGDRPVTLVEVRVRGESKAEGPTEG